MYLEISEFNTIFKENEQKQRRIIDSRENDMIEIRKLFNDELSMEKNINMEMSEKPKYISSLYSGLFKKYKYFNS